jgi:leukotriene-A4 hydrolase
MSLRAVLAAIALLASIDTIAACRGKGGDEDWGPDPHSVSRPDRVSVKHLVLDLTVDFDSKRLTGTARLSLTRHTQADLVLDSEGLTITGVKDCGGAPARYHERPLRIALASDCVEIAYTTSPDAGALLWVEPAGTASGKQPMLFTQSQATLARTWIPLQDSPSVRFTYDATVRVPGRLWALMSAENPQTRPADGVWRFKQPHPIPSYLMALAVGEFAFKPIGPRSGVYAEPSVVDAAAREFDEVEEMMAAAEQLYGPYRWGRYDMLVLPPSFPFGGMENPNLTFLTPTVITGDRALVSLIAHELAHSWSGNLATNSTWNEVWLNEGMTTYVENRVMERLRSAEIADIEWYLVGTGIQEVIAEAGPLSPRTRLAHNYGRTTSVDDIPGDVAYEKGALFLRTLELAYGRETFDRFLRGWFDRHAFQAVNTKQFIAEAREQLGTKVDLEGWLYGTDLPWGAAPTTSTRATALATLARDFADKGLQPDASMWTTLDWRVFLGELPATITRERLEQLDAAFGLTTSTNAEIAMHWLPRLVAADMRSAAPAIQAFLRKVGRRRMVIPLFEAMAAGGDYWRGLARDTFAQVAPRYHPITRDSVAKILAGP